MTFFALNFLDIQMSTRISLSYTFSATQNAISYYIIIVIEKKKNLSPSYLIYLNSRCPRMDWVCNKAS